MLYGLLKAATFAGLLVSTVDAGNYQGTIYVHNNCQSITYYGAPNQKDPKSKSKLFNINAISSGQIVKIGGPIQVN